jgi:hypothetical protein
MLQRNEMKWPAILLRPVIKSVLGEAWSSLSVAFCGAAGSACAESISNPSRHSKYDRIFSEIKYLAGVEMTSL